MPPDVPGPGGAPDELERALQALRDRPRSDGPAPDLAWRVAAGETATPDEHRRLLADPDTLLELGIASALLEVRGRPHADAARSADTVLARIGLGRARRRWAPIAAAATALAAAAVLLVVLWLDRDPQFAWTAVDVASRTTRAGDPEGLDFRVRLRPSAPAGPAVFAVAERDRRVAVLRLHPLTQDQLASRAFQAWPKGALPADADTVLPPAGMEPFALPAAFGFLVLVHAATGAIDEAAIAAVERALHTALEQGVDEPAMRAAAAALQARGFSVQWRALRAP